MKTNPHNHWTDKSPKKHAEQPIKNYYSSIDEIFLQKVQDSLEQNFTDQNFNCKNLADHLCLSISQLNRKLNLLSNQSAGKLIRLTRLKHAAVLLEHNSGNVSEIAYQVGFSDLAHFSRSFKKEFQCPPSQYRSNLKKHL